MNKYTGFNPLFILLTLILAIWSILSEAKGGGSVSVRGYTRSNGTYVAPHYRSSPDGNFSNNWSTKGNINPYTGEEGTLNYKQTTYPYSAPPESNINSSVPLIIPKNYDYSNNIDIINNNKSNNTASDYSDNKSECKNGFYKHGSECIAAQIPINSELNYFGNGWQCKYGFYQSGSQCLPVQIPLNAKLNYFGHGWECEYGFYQSGLQCLPVQIPSNSKLNYFGHGWECEYGFYQSGFQCLQVKLPQNSKLNYFGHGWECQYGFRQYGLECIPVGLR